MNEWALVWLVPFRLALLGGFVTCYIIGGRAKKWVRRFLGGGLFGAGLVLISMMTGSFKWPLLGTAGFYIGALCLGYGGDTTGEKFLRRLLYGAALGGAGLFVGLVTGHLFLAWLQFFLALGASPLFGLTNKEPAVNEEASIAVASTVFVPFMI